MRSELDQNCFDSQMVFLKEFFKNVDFEKSADDKKSMKNFPGGKQLISTENGEKKLSR